VQWLVQHVHDGSFANPSPIGFYFAKLWYFERLYPLVFTVAALRRALSCRRPAAAERPATADIA
jgi:squalene-hopene/tetraprenyl-beta-curcumene cyclase